MKSSARLAKALVIAFGLTGAIALSATASFSGNGAPPAIHGAGKGHFTPGEDRRCIGCHNPQPFPIDANGSWQFGK